MSSSVVRIPVRGRSMLPSLRDGDVIEVDLDRTPRAGEVALYMDGSTAILHRVLQVSPDAVLLQGDACRRPDAPVASARILGTARVPRRALLAGTRSVLERLRGLARAVLRPIAG